MSKIIWQVLNVKRIKIGNGKDVNHLKIALKNSWNHISWTYFWRILPIWNHSAALSWSRSYFLKDLRKIHIPMKTNEGLLVQWLPRSWNWTQSKICCCWLTASNKSCDWHWQQFCQIIVIVVAECCFTYRLFFLRSIVQFFTRIYTNCFVSS